MIPQHYIDILQAQLIELSRAESKVAEKVFGADQKVRNARAALRSTLERVEPFMSKQMALVSRALKSAANAYDDILDHA